MERFKQLQQEQQEKGVSGFKVSRATNPDASISKTTLDVNANDTRKTTPVSSGKLAFSLKQKSKLVAAPIKLGEDEDEDEGPTKNAPEEVPAKRQRLFERVREPVLQRRDVGNLF
ncbi:hypothetical protein GIB67_040143 [Kingdonia uniflora]|uniref:Uncharacterized protein n=1 Tax=Kingdonia uniflora TaxID=39325 RepID=A0A7J7MUM8_9MAGN|nr:hypothetical protein GIB67_040143 [Kingdonia uniflora]